MIVSWTLRVGPAATLGVDAVVHRQNAPAWDPVKAQPLLYQLIRQPGPIAERTFEVTFLDTGIQAYAFTFG